ncbi:MAG: DUF6883 domain-containing protein [Pyrinomonadaceae bacterium]
MKVPNALNAVIGIEKLTDYCLSASHSKGKHKARLFENKLSLGVRDAEVLQRALKDAILRCDAVEIESTAYGRKFRVDFRAGRGVGIIFFEATVRSVWIVRNDEDFPRLVTCYNPN